MDKFLERYSSAIEQAFGEYYRRHTSPEHLYQPVHYILSLGGKRLRPALVLLAADSFGCPLEKAMPAAMAIEVFHNFRWCTTTSWIMPPCGGDIRRCIAAGMLIRPSFRAM